MKRAALLLLLGLLLPAAVQASAPPPNVARQVAAIEQSTDKIRQLKPVRAVKAVFPSDKSFDASLSAEMHLDNPESEIAVGQRESVTMGLLGKNDDLHRIIYQGLSSQVLGFYDYHHKVLYVRSDANRVFGPERYAIAHEYTHALQDQHYNLQKLMPDQSALKYRNSDAVSAHHALTEGDAVTTQTLFIYRTYSSSDLRALLQLQAQPQKGPKLPTSIDREFYFPYTTGVSFVQRLYRDGGMPAVSAAYARLPISTYEIMYPDAYLKHWQPVSVRLHGVQGFAPGWTQEDDDVFGAFGYHLLLWQFLSKKTADGVTSAYRGDRYILLENGAQNAMLLKSVWTSSSTARTAMSALLSSLKARYHGHLTPAGSSSTYVDSDGGVYLRSGGTTVTLAYAPTVALAQQLGTATTS